MQCGGLLIITVSKVLKLNEIKFVKPKEETIEPFIFL